MHFHASVGEFARAVSITEHKNDHNSVRLIPDSLIQLAALTNTHYPMSETRFVAVRKFALENLKRFYGLRALCITQISMALHKTFQGFGQFHRAHTTTARFYIDSTNLQYLNAAFVLSWLPTPSEPARIKDVRLEFGKGTTPVPAPLNKNEKSDAHTPVTELIEANELDTQSTASGETMKAMQQLNDDGMNQLELVNFFANNQIMKLWGCQLSDVWFDSLDEAIVNAVHPKCLELVSFRILETK